MPRNHISSPPRRRLASIQVTADLYGVNPKTIRRRITDGTLTGYRMGRLLRVDLDEAERKLVRRIPTTGGAA